MDIYVNLFHRKYSTIGSEYVSVFNIYKLIAPIYYNFLVNYLNWFLSVWFVQLVAIFIALLSILQIFSSYHSNM